MEILLKKGKDKFRLSVLPSSFEVQSPQDNESVQTVSAGERNLIGKKGLRTITLSSFFPAHNYDFNIYKKIRSPYYYISKLGNWKGSVIQLSISGTNINWLCTIENLTYGESDGTRDVYYSIELKEYKKIKRESISNKKEKVSKTATKSTKKETKRVTKNVKTHTYIVKKGDTLTSIAKKETGSSSNWTAIYNTNKKIIGSNPNKIKIGQKLVIKV